MKTAAQIQDAVSRLLATVAELGLSEDEKVQLIACVEILRWTMDEPSTFEKYIEETNAAAAEIVAATN